MTVYVSPRCVRMSVGTTAEHRKSGSACWARTSDPLINSQQAEPLQANENAGSSRFARTRISQKHPISGHSQGFLCTRYVGLLVSGVHGTRTRKARNPVRTVARNSLINRDLPAAAYHPAHRIGRRLGATQLTSQFAGQAWRVPAGPGKTRGL